VCCLAGDYATVDHRILTDDLLFVARFVRSNNPLHGMWITLNFKDATFGAVVTFGLTCMILGRLFTEHL
jgi:hypothetical protein